MVVIFSSRVIEGLMGKYANPKFFDGTFEGCKVVMTDKEHIAKEARKQGLTVLPLTGTIQLEDVTPHKEEDNIDNLLKPYVPPEEKKIKVEVKATVEKLTPAQKRKATIAAKKAAQKDK